MLKIKGILVEMKIKTINSPNFDGKSRNIKKIKFIIIHYTGMQSKRVSLKRLSDKKSKVSCHYLIDRMGKCIRLVKENKVAWHAGKSKWKNFINLNFNSLGIELVNKGHKLGYQKFSKKQIKSLTKILFNLQKKYKIKNTNILGHSDIAPLRKLDPGEKFPWKRIYKNIFNFETKNIKIKKKISKRQIRNEFFKNLYKIGYRYFFVNRPSKNDIKVIKAFQRRYSQTKIDGKIDQKILKISHFLATRS